MIVETDDFFCHQIAEPHAHVLLNDPLWAERAYFTMTIPGRFGMDLGVSLYPNNDAMEAYAVAARPGGQSNLRSARDLSGGRWKLGAGPQRFEVVEPMGHWRLECDENESGISYALDMRARALPYECRSPHIRRKGRLVYDNVNMFQSVRWHGEVTVDGETFELDGVPGHRDRTWGVRASGEGRIARGLLLWVSAEFDDVSVMALIHERHNGDRRRTAGAVSWENDDQVELVDYRHDLEFDHDSRQWQRGVVTFTDAEGGVWEINAEHGGARMFLAGAGYLSEESGGRRGEAATVSRHERWQTDDPALLPRIDGLNDNVARFLCGEREGRGIVETLIGRHDRYQVAELPVGGELVAST